MIYVALLGFGVIGSGTAEVLTQNSALIESRVGQPVSIKYILDLRDFPDSPFADRIVHDVNIILADPEVSIVVEMMGGLHPAYDFSRAALEAGKHVITSNKAVVAAYGEELLTLAEEKGLRYLFEASVGGGIPIIRPLCTDLAPCHIEQIVGILNGTTNYILTRMAESGASFADALKEAQKLGYAEQDPTADVDGWDTARKICILAAIASGKIPSIEQIPVEGITRITVSDIENASRAGYSIKLIGAADLTADKPHVRVCPCLVPAASPLSTIHDVFNGIMIRSEFLGKVMFYGRGAGSLPTAAAVVADILDIAGGSPYKPSIWHAAAEGELGDPASDTYRRYLCLNAVEGWQDIVASILGKAEIIDDQGSEIALITDLTREDSFSGQIAALEAAGMTLISSIRVL